MNRPGENRQEKSQYREMTVAQLREREGADSVQVAFFQSARFYRLLRKNPAYERILNLLRNAKSTGHVVKVQLASQESDVIEDVV
jgi:hypothetical protein